jgi:protein ImuA
MPISKADIISKLQQDILLLQGLRPASDNSVDVGLQLMKDAFPNASFPTGAVHEFLSAGEEYAAATTGFLSGLLGNLMRRGGACIWIGSSQTIFPPALKSFGIAPDRVIFVNVKRETDALWAMEEALKCEGLAAVVGEVREISFTASRRLQLAVEQSRVTGFVLRHRPRNLSTTAFVSRWQIAPLASEQEGGMPGLGFPRWRVELLKIRNGRPGVWQLEWFDGGFRQVLKDIPAIQQPLIRKIG